MDVTKSCRDIKELTPQAQVACGLFLSECKKQGLNVLITETYRPQERQDYLYQQGRTRSGKVVTWTHNSRHTSRRAWDICKNVKGQEYSDSTFFKKCGEIAAELGITWGGIWKSSPDTPHFEISTDWKAPTCFKQVSKTQPQNVIEVNDNYLKAVDVLIKKGIISSPTIWKQDTFNKENVHSLIIKIADKI